MKQLQELYKRIIVENAWRDGEITNIQMRKTRSGNTASVFGHTMSFDMRDGFPAVTTKKLAWKAVVGELLWMLSGSTDLPTLRKYTELEEDAWTIWSDDCERWHKGKNHYCGKNDLGLVYGSQWRNYGSDPYRYMETVDQIAQLINSLKECPESRYHLVSAWNPITNKFKDAALPSCHMMFQCYVEQDDNGEYKWLDLMWHQRSCDSFLGLPFNIASYGLLLHILARLTGYRPRFLKCTLGDTHIYEQHLDQCQEMINREPLKLPTLNFRKVESLDDVLSMTASDFKLTDYVNHGKLSGKLTVGE